LDKSESNAKADLRLGEVVYGLLHITNVDPKLYIQRTNVNQRWRTV